MSPFLPRSLAMVQVKLDQSHAIPKAIARCDFGSYGQVVPALFHVPRETDVIEKNECVALEIWLELFVLRVNEMRCVNGIDECYVDRPFCERTCGGILKNTPR